MNQDQINSIVRKLLAMVASILGAHGLTAMATTVNSSDTTELVVGVIMAGASFYASHKTHADAPVVTSTTPPSK